MENNKKTEAIKKSLGELLIKLECQKQMIAPREYSIYIGDRIAAPYDSRNKLKSLDIAIGLLGNLTRQFDSVDDFNSVKKLRETELYFFNNHDLRKFTFPNYSLQIDPNLLDYVNIEIRLDELSKKADDLDRRGYHSEGMIAKGVKIQLQELNYWYFEAKVIDSNEYKTRALTIINEARPLLKQHRSCKKILVNFFLFLISLGTAQAGNKIVNNRFLFFPETKSSVLLTKLEHRVSQLNS